MQKPEIKSVDTNKEGRFWAINVDGKLLAMVLYKNGAIAIQEMIQRLAGLPVTRPEKPEPKTNAKPAKDAKESKGKESNKKAKPAVSKKAVTKKPESTRDGIPTSSQRSTEIADPSKS